ncbi:phosphate ABC transporter permease subunit PstC [Kordiimonas sp.]|uniref:phosphate ABC transporter permease subunit PstC n=1 Tax=Kordiimonas sp. TaxID=1970157 RepID=UPI003A925B74
MTSAAIFLTLILLAIIAFATVRQRSLAAVSGDTSKLHSLPRHYGYYAAVCTLIPGLAVFLVWVIFGKNIIEGLVISGLPDNLAAQYHEQATLILNRIRLAVENSGGNEKNPDILAAAQQFHALYLKGIWAAFALSVSFGLIGIFFATNKTSPDFRARNSFERVLTILLVLSSVIAIITTLGIVASLLFESLRFFQEISVVDFVFGLHWSPQTALRADQVAAAGAFGAVPLFAGTLLISLLAMMVAGPIGLFSAIYLTQYASSRVRKIAKPVLEVLAGVPTVVYGFFAALTVAPFFRDAGDFIGVEIASESALAAGFVMGIMIIPFVSSLSDDAITAVPNSLKDGSLALGATRSETIVSVLLPAALPGIVGAFLLAVSRAVGETMIVVMAAGMQPNLTANPFEAVTTVTVQIVALLTGDQEFDSAKTLSAFALGLALFVSTMALNIFALRIVRKYREAYD